jgi:hypothetical protein
MKKIFSILLTLLACYCFVGCVPTPNGDDIVTAKETDNHIIIENGMYDIRVYSVSYKGHKYLFFNSEYRLGVVHDPDCPCHKIDTIVIRQIEQHYREQSIKESSSYHTSYDDVYGTGY